MVADCGLPTFGFIWILTHYGIQLSMRVTAVLGGIELLIMLSLAGTFLVHPGPGIPPTLRRSIRLYRRITLPASWQEWFSRSSR